MKRSTFLGSAVSVLLLFSVISYSRTFVQQQDPKPATQTAQTPNPTANSSLATTETAPAATEASASAAAVVNSPTNTPAAASSSAEKAAESVAAESYTATAYSLRGRTASGKPVARGQIAADPRFLPLGTRVRIEAGSLSGEYVVADTGGAVRGRRIDIWTPTAGEAMRFGRRAVKLTVLEFGGKRAKTEATRPRTVNPASTDSSVAGQTPKQEK